MKNTFENDMTEMLILHALEPGDSCGYDISQHVIHQSRGQFDLLEGDLYPVLHRMEREGLLASYWLLHNQERRRKFYRMTPEGQMLLESRREQWRQFSTGHNGVLGAPQSSGFLGALLSIRRGESTLSTAAAGGRL